MVGAVVLGAELFATIDVDILASFLKTKMIDAVEFAVVKIGGKVWYTVVEIFVVKIDGRD